MAPRGTAAAGPTSKREIYGTTRKRAGTRGGGPGGEADLLAFNPLPPRPREPAEHGGRTLYRMQAGNVAALAGLKPGEGAGAPRKDVDGQVRHGGITVCVPLIRLRVTPGIASRGPFLPYMQRVPDADIMAPRPRTPVWAKRFSIHVTA